MTIHVKQHTRIVNGKLVIVHEHQKQGGGVHHEIIQPEEVHDEFEAKYGHHQEEAKPTVDKDDTGDDYEGAFGGVKFDEDATNDDFDGHDWSEKEGQEEPAEPEKTSPSSDSNPTIGEMLGIGGQEWQKKGNERIYFNGLHQYLPGSKASSMKGVKVYFDKKDGQFHSKNLSESDASTIIEAIKKKAKQWGTENKLPMADAASSVDAGPKVGDANVPFEQLKAGMVFESTASTYEVTQVFNDELVGVVIYKGTKPSAELSTPEHVWSAVSKDFTLKEIKPVADKPHYDPGSNVPFEHLQPGMSFVSPLGVKWEMMGFAPNGNASFKWTQTNGATGTEGLTPDAWSKHFEKGLMLADKNQNKQRAESAPKVGDSVPFEKLAPGMIVTANGVNAMIVGVDGDIILHQMQNGELVHAFKSNWDKNQDKVKLVDTVDKDWNPKPHDGLKVGDTKVINGKTYRLNENHRWELVEGAVMSDTHQMLNGMGTYDWTNHGNFKFYKNAYNFVVLKQGVDGKPLPAKVKAALKDLDYGGKKKQYHIQIDKAAELAAVLDGGVKAKAKAKPKPAPQPMVPSVTVDGTTNIKNWKLLDGTAKGSNEGGLYEDETGKKWYVKFPKDPSIAKNEILASKLYQACGVDTPHLDSVSKDGKMGVASEWQDGLQKGGAGLSSAGGAKDGFVIDAWLANWDVIGLGYDNMLVKDGKAVRIDPGGALLYRAQGTPKGDAFGNTVPELHSMRDASANAQAASVFGSITSDELNASAAKLLELSDDDIRQIVKSWGPGGSEDRDGLADKLIARKAYIAKQFPNAKPKPVVNLNPTPNFKEWNGQGKGLSSKPWINEQNQDLAQQIHDIGKQGDVKALEDFKFQPISYDTGEAVGSPVPISEHKSHWITDYWKDVIGKAKNPEVVYKKLKADLLSNLKAMAGKAHAIAAAFPDVAKLLSCQKRIGRYGVMGKFDTDPLAGWAPKEVSQKNGGVDINDLFEQSKASFDKLTSTQRQAIKFYTASGYKSINNASTGEGASGQTQHAIEGLNQASIPLPEGMVLSRKFGFDKDSAHNHELLMGSLNSVLKDYGVISTATTPGTWGNSYQLRITVAKGVKGLYVANNPKGGGGAISEHPSENEVILPYGTKFLVRKIHHNGFSDAHGSWDGGGKGIVIDVVALPHDQA